MRKLYAKSISNLIKILVVAFIFFNYVYQSRNVGRPLTADEGKSLLYIAIAGFLILCPIDASIFIKNLKSLSSSENQNNLKKEETGNVKFDGDN